MTLFTTRWAMAAAVTVGLAGLIGVAAPAASATSHTTTRAAAAAGRAPAPFHHAGPFAGIGRFEIAAGGPHAVCAIKVAPSGRLPRLARPSSGVFHSRPRLTKLKPSFLPFTAKGRAVLCGPVGGPSGCAGIMHGTKGAPAFVKLPVLRVRAFKFRAGVKLRALRSKAAFGQVFRLEPLACSSSK